jgi:hypothetical protein
MSAEGIPYIEDMKTRLITSAFFISVSLAFAQLDSNSVTVTASREASAQPDQVLIVVSVATGLNNSLNDVVAVLQGSGMNASNLVDVRFVEASNGYGPEQPAHPPLLEWNFNLPTPISRLKETTAMLSAVQQALVQKKSDFLLSFRVERLQVSPQAQQLLACNLADVVSDARMKAQKLANAAGRSLGVLLAISSFDYYGTGCSATVKFAMGF